MTEQERMSPEAFKRFLIDSAKLAMDQKGGDEYVPTIVLEDHNYKAIVMLLMGAHPYDMVRACIPALQEHEPFTVSLTVDSYMAVGPTGLASRSLFGDNLERALAAGAPGVTECLTIHIVTKDTMELVSLPYVREDDGHIVWGEPIEQDGLGVGGRMSDALRLVWTS